jgi:hypothetical protein
MPGRSALEDVRGRISRVEARVKFYRRSLGQSNLISHESVAFAKTALHVLERSLKLMRMRYDRLASEDRQRQKQETENALAKRRLRMARLNSTNENRTMRPS